MLSVLCLQLTEPRFYGNLYTCDPLRCLQSASECDYRRRALQHLKGGGVIYGDESRLRRRGAAG